MKIEKLSDRKYFVYSDSGKIYEVKFTGESKSTVSCNCQGFTFRRSCKHIDAVRELLKDKGKVIRVAAAPRDPYDYREVYEKQIKEKLEFD